MSWEKEESKSRHVDFQCVKPKHSTGLVGAVDEPAALANAANGQAALPPPPVLLGAVDPPPEMWQDVLQGD